MRNYRQSTRPKCRICGKSIYKGDKLWKYQTVHTRCELKRPPDLVFDKDKCHIELHSALLPPTRLKKLIGAMLK